MPAVRTSHPGQEEQTGQARQVRRQPQDDDPDQQPKRHHRRHDPANRALKAQEGRVEPPHRARIELGLDGRRLPGGLPTIRRVSLIRYRSRGFVHSAHIVALRRCRFRVAPKLITRFTRRCYAGWTWRRTASENSGAKKREKDDGHRAQLRSAREGKGLSIGTLAERTRVPVRTLAAIERNDQSALPPHPFGRGFVRAYAEEVDLDSERLVREYFAQFPSPPPASNHVPRSREPLEPSWQPPSRWIGMGTAVAILLRRRRGGSSARSTKRVRGRARHRRHDWHVAGHRCNRRCRARGGQADG